MGGIDILGSLSFHLEKTKQNFSASFFQIFSATRGARKLETK